jgi:DsbC/DsbD-like thiol-disulfide interchange protein
LVYALESEYLVCKDLCLPGKSSVKGEIRVSDSPISRIAPPRFPQSAKPDSVTFSAKGDDITLTFTLPESPKGEIKSAYFFPATGAVLDHEAQQKWHLDGTRLILQVKRSNYATTPFASVEGVLVLTWTEPGDPNPATRQLAIEYSRPNTQEKPE